MVANNKQLMRLVKFVAELKKNNYPNCTSFIEKLKNVDIDENIYLSCSVKTIQRDIKALKEIHKAPIDFDHERNGYYLKHHGWSFEAPVYSENDMTSLIIASKLAESITPNPLSSQISEAIDELLTSNNPEILDTATIDSIVASSALNVKIKAHIFKIVFGAWKQNRTINIRYSNADGEISERRIDPHVLSYYNKAWYVKAYCHLKESIRTFAVHRIMHAELTEYTYEFDEKMLEGINGSPFNLDIIKDVKLWCTAEISTYIVEKAAADRTLSIEHNNDGSVIITYPTIFKHDLIRWLLAEGGNMKLLTHPSLQAEVKNKALEIAKLYR